MTYDIEEAARETAEAMARPGPYLRGFEERIPLLRKALEAAYNAGREAEDIGDYWRHYISEVERAIEPVK